MGIAKTKHLRRCHAIFLFQQGFEPFPRGLQAGQHILMRRFKISDEREIF
jgi:hypothetical protein